MKTTIELPEDLLARSRRTAKKEGITLKALMIEGLQRALSARAQRKVPHVKVRTYGGSGLTPEFEGAGWAQLREEIYRGRGG